MVRFKIQRKKSASADASSAPSKNNTLASRVLYRISTISTYIFIVIFGLSSWITINGVYSQAPIFIMNLPEGVGVMSYMSFALQLANIIPLLHLVASALFVRPRYKFLWDTVSAMVLIVFGIVCTVLLGFLWNQTAMINGAKTSIWLYILVFLNGAVDCTSTVIYFPLISNYRFLFSSALTLGEGLTGGIAGILALIQQPGSATPLFGVLGMSIALAVFMLLSLIALILLTVSPLGRLQRRKNEGLIPGRDQPAVPAPQPVEIPELASQASKEEVVPQQAVQVVIENEQPQTEATPSTAVADLASPVEAEAVVEQPLPKPAKEKKPMNYEFRWTDTLRLALMEGLISLADNGIMGGASAYIFYHYPQSSQLISYSYNIGLVLDPISCFVAYVIPMHRHLMWLFHAAWAVIHIFLFAIALCGPNVPAKDSLGMGIFLVILKILGKCFIAFCKTKEFLIAHHKLQKWEEQKAAEAAALTTPLIEAPAEAAATEPSKLAEEVIVADLTTSSGELVPVPPQAEEQQQEEKHKQYEKEAKKQKKKCCCNVDIGPFRIAGFAIQLFALLGTLFILLLTQFKVLK